MTGPWKRKEVIGNCTLYLGDCLEVLGAIGPVDAVVTDPPFGVGFKYASHDDRPEAYEGGYSAWLWKILEQAEGLCSPGSPIFVWQASPQMREFSTRFPREWRIFCAAKNFVQMRPTAMQWSYDPIIVWWTPGEKPWSAGSATRDFHIANTAPVVATPENIEKGHPCPRPLDQVRHIIEQWCRPGSNVLDPFMGSGTTGVACVKSGRAFVGVEKEPAYFEIALERIRRSYAQRDMFATTTLQPEQLSILDGAA